MREGVRLKGQHTGKPKHGMVNAREALAKCRIELLKTFPLYGVPLFQMRFLKTARVPTTAISPDGTFYYNEAWINGMTLKDVRAEMVHELGHMITRCFSRFPGGGDHGIWNLANDQIIDTHVVIEAGIEPSWIMNEMTTPQVQKEAKKDKITEVRYRNLLKKLKKETKCAACKMMAEMGLKMLEQEQDEQEQQEQQQNGKGQQQGQDGQGDQNSQSGQGGGQSDQHQHGPDGNPCDHQSEQGSGQGQSQGTGGGSGSQQQIPPHTCGNIRQCTGGSVADLSNADPSKKAEFDIKWKQALMKGYIAQKSKGKGSIPGFIEEFLSELVKPQVKWQDHIRATLKRTVNKPRWTYKQPSRRAQAIGLILPGRESEMKGVVCCIDTSGSVSDQMIKWFVSEVVGIMKQCHVPKIHLLLHDCVVYSFEEYDENTIKNIKVQRGGTSHVPVFEKLYELKGDDRPCTVICFTDLMTDFHNKKPDFPVLWCVLEEDSGYEIPYGKKVVVKAEKYEDGGHD